MFDYFLFNNPGKLMPLLNEWLEKKNQAGPPVCIKALTAVNRSDDVLIFFIYYEYEAAAKKVKHDQNIHIQ
jgi:hypothetical protein